MKNDDELIEQLTFSHRNENVAFHLPMPLQDALRITTDFFARSLTNKLCIIFPSKEFAAQWLSVPLTLRQIRSDFHQFKNEIDESYKSFKMGDKLLLNNAAVVEWVRTGEITKKGRPKKVAIFRTKSTKESASLEISIPFEKITKLQRTSKNTLSSQKKVMSVLPKEATTPLDQLLNITAFGNQEFIRNKVCLVTKYKSFDDSVGNISLGLQDVSNYFSIGKIDDNGVAEAHSPLLLCHSLTNLTLYSTGGSIGKILIDGIAFVHDRSTDFADINAKRIPTILVTDLSEIEHFEFISNYGFEFFNFTKDQINLSPHSSDSPFKTFNTKLNRYVNFTIKKEICNDQDLEALAKSVESIEPDISNRDLNAIRIQLIQLTNYVSRACHNPNVAEINSLSERVNIITNQFNQSRRWLGSSLTSIHDSITILKHVVEKLSKQPSEKSEKLRSLLSHSNYDYIVCPSESEAYALKASVSGTYTPQIISLSDVSDSLLTTIPTRAIVTGWARSNSINRILHSFTFSEITFLLYAFENRYFDSLLQRNKKQSQSTRTTIFDRGPHDNIVPGSPHGFYDLYSDGVALQITSGVSFDILKFESSLDNAQYAKYLAKNRDVNSIKAKRVDLQYDQFIYSSDSHKFLVINELIETRGEKGNPRLKKLDALRTGDIIAIINTDRDILAELVEKNTNREDLARVKRWTELWKNLLKQYFASIGGDFPRLVDNLRKNHCKKHPSTIRTWLNDENMIGPEDNNDLISIALLTKSNLLRENVAAVRGSIREMTGWRMKAADLISAKIKARIHEFADSSAINKKVMIEGLGSVSLFKVIEISNAWEEIDARYANRLLQRETI